MSLAISAAPVVSFKIQSAISFNVSKSASAFATISATLAAAILVAVLATEPASSAPPFNTAIAAAFAS